MRQSFLLVLLVLFMTSLLCFVGCSRDSGIIDIPIDPDIPDGWVIKNMFIRDIEISISESRPAQVMVTVYGGSHPDTCVAVHEVYHKREGNIIYIQATKTVPGTDIVVTCGTAVTEPQKHVSIGEFTVGEYKVIANGIEQMFRIEEDESWIIRNSPFIDDFEILISESRPAQVTVNVEGNFWEACIPFLETHQKQEGNSISIQIIEKIPSGIRCPLRKDRPSAYLHLPRGFTGYQSQVSIGEFTAGEYTVEVNGITEVFVIE
ncbi:hypothetical protein C6501_03960 [Candidatus Poribacteria bacterium]|nr:MAG: hypothetical protein C6501_03960 [Candidatus Poribacteria bacterium]